MSREELKNLTVKELDSKAKELGLSRYKGKKHLTKDELIESIINTSGEEKEDCLAKEFSDKMLYIGKAKIEDIVAFKDKRDLVRSGKIIKNDVDNQKMIVQIKSGKTFYITYSDILWVTTEDNKKWPKEILRLLKESQKKIVENFNNIMSSKGGSNNEQIGTNNS